MMTMTLFLLLMLSVHAVIKTDEENLDDSFLVPHKFQDLTPVKTIVLKVDQNNVDEENFHKFPFDPGIFDDVENDAEETKAKPVEDQAKAINGSEILFFAPQVNKFQRLGPQCRLLLPEKKNLFYFRSTLLSTAKRPSCQSISNDLCRLECGVLVISYERGFNSSNVTDPTDVSEVDGKDCFDQETLKKKSWEKKTWHLR